MADDVKIVMFCCNWCSYGGADTAGTARMQYPPNIRVIRVMCSGRIDPQFVLKAFKEGADGVFVAGCHMGDCHYDAGNYKLDRRMRLIYKLVEDFSQAVNMIVNRIKDLGPAPLKEQLQAEN